MPSEDDIPHHREVREQNTQRLETREAIEFIEKNEDSAQSMEKSVEKTESIAEMEENNREAMAEQDAALEKKEDMEKGEAMAAALPRSVILHVDLDCFYAAVEQVRLGIPPEKPLAVQQWEGLIAVNYPARAAGVVRHDRVSEALRKCPDLYLVHVETVGNVEGTAAAASRGSAKVSLERYRQASRCVFEIFHQHADICERASIDEAYIDVTRQVETLVEQGCNWDNELRRLLGDQRMTERLLSSEEKPGMVVEKGSLKTSDAVDRRLLAGAVIAERIRVDVRTKLGYTCSVGIATNKLLAKIASARNKPDQQTLILPSAIADLMDTLPLKKVKLLGGKIGQELFDKWGCTTAGEAQKVPLQSLLTLCGDRLGHYVFRAIRGIQEDKVQEKQIPKSMLAAKSFETTQDLAVIRKWLGILAEELSIRILQDTRENHRQPHNLQLYYRCGLSRQTGDHSKSCPMPHAILQLLSSLCLSSSKIEYQQPKSEPTDAFQEPEKKSILQPVPPFVEDNVHHALKIRSDFVEENNSRIGSSVLGSGNEVDEASIGMAKDMAKLLQESSLNLFQRIEGAFPCTRLAIAASGFQDIPLQRPYSIQHFFNNAFRGRKAASLKSSSTAQNLVVENLPEQRPRGLLRYMNSNSSDSKHPHNLHSSDSNNREEYSQIGNGTGSSHISNSITHWEEADNCKGLVIQETCLLKAASHSSHSEKSDTKCEALELCCQELHSQLEQASTSDVIDRIPTNCAMLNGVESSRVHNDGSTELQSTGGISFADGEQQVDLRSINVEEQRRILEGIHGARPDSKGNINGIHKRHAALQERHVTKQIKFTSPKPGQMALSKYFHIVDNSSGGQFSSDN